MPSGYILTYKFKYITCNILVMLTDEIFWKMDLRCVYSDGEISEIRNGFYVYIIVNRNKYYIGLTRNIKNRLQVHIGHNTNDIRDDDACVYILENLKCEYDMRIMEYVWIIWFCLNTECVNKQVGSYKIRNGSINNHNMCFIDSNYNMFCDYELIQGIKIIDRQDKAMTEIEYFGKKVSRV